MLLDVIIEIFNEIVKPAPCAPTVWKESRVRVLFKKGDARLPDNYRPITLLKILHTLFSRMVMSRIQGVLEGAQSVDQAGFRAGFGIDDHLFTMTLLIERCAEFNVPLWACAIDFRKAFDTVEHSAVWKAMLDQGVPLVYIRTMAALYENQV